MVASLSLNSCSPRTLKFQVHILWLIEQIAVGNCAIVLTEESDPKRISVLDGRFTSIATVLRDPGTCV
jgi:hypothetical protein